MKKFNCFITAYNAGMFSTLSMDRIFDHKDLCITFTYLFVAVALTAASFLKLVELEKAARRGI